MTRRTTRVAELIREEISRLIARERTLEGTLLTLTYVEVSTDLKHASVYYTSLSTHFKPNDLQEKLDHLRHPWQQEIGRHMHTKFTPKLSFRLDHAHQRGDRVMQLLDSLSSDLSSKAITPPKGDKNRTSSSSTSSSS